MTKEQCVAKLRECGYEVDVINSVVMLNLPETYEEDYKDKFVAKVREIGYDQSFGWNHRTNSKG